MAPADASAAAPAELVQRPRLRARSVLLALFALALVGAALWAGLRPDKAAPIESAARPFPITRFPGLEVEPAISPAGTFVAFAWDGKNEDNFDIYVRSIDGKSHLQLTTDPAPDHAPAWSPDGQRIAFIRVVAGRRKIMVIPALGGPEEQLFEAGGRKGAPRKGAAGATAAGRTGSRGRRMASTWSTAIGTPVSRRPSICTRSGTARDGS